MRDQLYSLHKKIYRSTMSTAASYTQHTSDELKKYQQDQKKYAKRKYAISNQREILNSIRKGQIIYLGDFHTFDQSSQNLKRIIHSLLRNQESFILAMEMVSQQDQNYIDAYINHDLTELEFLDCINYSESWRFPWNHYKYFFTLARKKNISIKGLNSQGGLHQRDIFAAQIIADLTQLNPNHKILVLFGELHIVPNKIPQLVAQACNEHNTAISQTIIHQNLDEIYWSLRRGRQKSKIVKFGTNEFSLQTSPPWVKYESMIYWFEHLCDDPDFDIHEYIMETGHKTFGSNTNDFFLAICKQIVNFLQVKIIQPAHLEDYNLYDHKSLEFVINKIETVGPPAMKNYLTQLIALNQIFKLPDSNIYYCSNYSMNRLAYMAGIHIFHAYLETKRSISLSSSSKNRKFIFLLKQHMVAFFASKIINPHRKCDLYQDMTTRSQNKNTPAQTRKFLQLALQIIDEKNPEQNNLDAIFYRKPLIYFSQISKICGHFFCELLFEKFNEGDNISVNFVRNFLLSTNFNISELKKIKEFLLADNEYKTQKKRFF